MDARRRHAWKAYFEVQALLFDQMAENHQVMLRMTEKIRVLSEEHKIEVPPHFSEELVQSLQDITCPICMDVMTKATFVLTRCFHKVCKPCMEQVNKCPICRRDF
jgi:hypothetical protein